MTMVNMPEIATKTSKYCRESPKISVYNNAKYYDEIITKTLIQTKQGYKYTSRNLQKQGTEEQEQEEMEYNHNTRISKRILLVDDEPDLCMVYQIVLEDAGYECVSYIDSVKALQDFRPAYYDLILLDIKMPVLNGFELCKKILELDKTVHIIFITASEEYYEKFRSQHFPELGKINYIQKPIGNDELLQIVNMIIANSITVD
jgi:CheY-like chemotaxis protein